MSETSLKQATLKIEVEGVLSEKNLELTVENNVEHIKGDIVIQTDTTNFVSFRVDQYSKKKAEAGKFSNDDNKVFPGLKTIFEQYKSIAEVGREEATIVRITTGQINPFSYYSNDKRFIEGVGYKGTYFNRLKADEELNPRADFTVQMYIFNIAPEVDEEGQTTGRLLVNGWCPTFNGIEKIQLIAPETCTDGDEVYEVASAIQEEFEVGQTVEFYGKAVNSRVVKETTIPVKLGKPKKKIETSYKNEFEITGASEPFPEETAYKEEAIKQAIQERENRLEEQKNKPTSGSSSSNGGFSSRRPTPSGRTLPNF